MPTLCESSPFESSSGVMPKQTSATALHNTTKLEPTISGLAWQDRFSLGCGVNAITGSVTVSPLAPFQAQKRTVKSSEEHYRFIQSDSDMNQEVQASLSGSYNVEGVTVSASSQYLTKIRYSELSITLIAEYKSTYDGYDTAPDYKLTSDAQALLQNPDKFREQYGDYYISGSKRASRFLGIYTCQAKTAERMNEFKANLGASAPAVFTAEGSSKFAAAASSNNVSISADLFMEGYTGKAPDGPWTPETIIKALNWFKGAEVGIEQQAQLTSYAHFCNDYPSCLAVSPDTFIDLKTLYTTVWNIRAKYNSCPPVYQAKLTGEFNNLDFAITAKQNILATDEGERERYSESAQALLEKLNGIYDRMDFFFKVAAKVSSEPSKDQEIEDGSSISPVWCYGYITYPESNAVQIDTQESPYRTADWEIGHQESTLSFSNQSRLIVGWEVISNWGDGTNGSWWKPVDQNLLGSSGAVHVKSAYDRGCSWTVKFYHVDAALYQF